MSTLFDITEEETPIFMAEADEQLQVLDEGLIELERSGGGDPDLLQALFRAAHTLKGSSGMINHKRMVALTHAMENALDGLRKNTLTVSAELIDTCLQSVDNLRILCDEITSGEISNVEVDTLVQQLIDISQDHKKTNDGQTQDAKSASETQEPAVPGALFVRAKIAEDSIASAARAFQLMLALQSFGQILSMDPSQEQIETAAPVSVFTAQVATDVHSDKVRQALEAIADIDELFVGKNQPEHEETQANSNSQRSSDIPEQVVPLGQILLQNKLIGEDQLQHALAFRNNLEGPKPLLGQTLIQMGYITQEILDQVIQDQNSQKKSTKKQDAGKSKSRRKHNEKTVRTSVERLDNLMNLVGELITDRNRLYLIRGGLEARYRDEEKIDALSDTITHIGRITDQLQAEVMSIRMLPIGNVFNKFPRLVRDLARKSGKQVDLLISGEDTELDRSVIEEISDPLIHLLRNAVDHGLEPPKARKSAGKPERGVIKLTARHEQGRIIVTVEDDGRGIDAESVKAKAIEKGLISKAEAEALTVDEAIDLIFRSGLSTAKVVSDVSGRGVGMDIVRNNIEQLNGAIIVETWPGRGSQFQIVLPLTLAIVPTLLVRVGGHAYAIPLVTVTETLRTPVSDIKTINNRPVIVLRNQVLPVVRLSDVFASPIGPNGHSQSKYEFIVVVRSGKSQLGLIVDTLIGEEEVVVKSLSSMIGELVGISSAAILGDGRVALIVDVQGLFKLVNQQQTHQIPSGVTV